MQDRVSEDEFAETRRRRQRGELEAKIEIWKLLMSTVHRSKRAVIGWIIIITMIMKIVITGIHYHYFVCFGVKYWY